MDMGDDNMSCIVILDFGNEYNDGLRSLIEDRGYDVSILPYNTTAETLKTYDNLIGIILSGGYITIREDDLEAFDGRILELGLPILGLGRGMQVIINELGGDVEPAGYIYEPTQSRLTFHKTQSGILQGLEDERIVDLGFDAKVSRLPDGFTVLASGEEVASGDDRPFGAMEDPDRGIYGIQFVTRPGEKKDDQQAIINFLQICDKS